MHINSWRFFAQVVGGVAVLGCASAPRSKEPVFTTGVWQVRMDIDSAPTRRAPKEPLFGTIDFVNHRHAIKVRSFSNAIETEAYIAVIDSASETTRRYKITLGDSSSMDEKIIMTGRLVARDSIVGTWTETILCCSAAGRFSLWRAASPR